jgi:hypothetical protein
MFNFNFYRIQEFVSGSLDEAWYIRLFFEAIGPAIGAFFGYWLANYQANKERKENDEIFLNYCFELIRQSGRVTLRIQSNLRSFQCNINPYDVNVLNEVAVSNSERFSKVDHARFTSLLQARSPVVKISASPSAEQIFRLINWIDFISGGQASALRHILSENGRIKEIDKQIRELHDKLIKVIGNPKLAEVLSLELMSDRGVLNNMNIPELLQRVINPIASKVEGDSSWPNLESRAAVQGLIRQLNEAVNNIKNINSALQSNITVRLEMFENATAEIDKFLRDIGQNTATSQVRDFRESSND